MPTAVRRENGPGISDVDSAGRAEPRSAGSSYGNCWSGTPRKAVVLKRHRDARHCLEFLDRISDGRDRENQPETRNCDEAGRTADQPPGGVREDGHVPLSYAGAQAAGRERRTGRGRKLEFPNPFAVDITEIEGFDNLHHPEGILRESMGWAAGVYGADRTYYLVNGSSSGILAAISAAVGHGGRILAARNCHKSVYHAVYLNRMKSVYLYPQTVPGLGIQGGILPGGCGKRPAAVPGYPGGDGGIPNLRRNCIGYPQNSGDCPPGRAAAHCG